MTILNHPAFFPAVRAHHAEHAHRWTPGEIVISGRIANRTTLDVAARLRHAAGRAVTVHVDSPGGEVDAARDIVALLSAYRDGHGAEVRTVIGRAGSAAGVVAQAGHPRVMRTHGRVMLHLPYQERPNSTVTATAVDMLAVHRDGRAPASVRTAAATHCLSLIACAEGIADVYAQRSGRPAEVWRTAMTEEQTYAAYAAVLAGLADEVEA